MRLIKTSQQLKKNLNDSLLKKDLQSQPKSRLRKTRRVKDHQVKSRPMNMQVSLWKAEPERNRRNRHKSSNLERKKGVSIRRTFMSSDLMSSKSGILSINKN